MSTITNIFSATGNGGQLQVSGGGSYYYTLAEAVGDTFDGEVVLEFTPNGGLSWTEVATFDDAVIETRMYNAPAGHYRFRCTTFNGGSDNLVATLRNAPDVIRSVQGDGGIIVDLVDAEGVYTQGRHFVDVLHRAGTEFESFDAAKVARRVRLIHRPDDDADYAIAAADWIDVNPDSSEGDHNSVSHDIGSYVYLKPIGGGVVSQGFCRENRYSIADGTTVGTLYGSKDVLDLDGDVSGTAVSIVLHEMSDFTGTATWFTNLLTRILDPRHVHITKGGHVGSAKVIVDDYTLTDQDSGATLLMFAGAPKTITAPDTLAEGFSCTIIQGDANQVTVAASGTRSLFNEDTHTKTAGAYAVVHLHCPTSTTAFLSGNTGA